MAEQLICNQQVDGSTPFTSSNMGDFPSGQRGQTVNLLSLTSVVRIHHPPPTKTEHLSTDKCSVFVYPSRRLGISSPHDVRCISSRAHCALVSHHATACIYLRLDDIQPYGLMIYRNKLRMIYTPYGVIWMRDCGKYLKCFAKYDIIPLKGVILWLKTIY